MHLLAQDLIESARQLPASDVDFSVLCINVMHHFCDVIENAITILFLYIADPMAEMYQADSFSKSRFLGYTLHDKAGFFKITADR